ncbi:hypothetical protein FQN57_006523 [Myotisia sp. PD_48]|nr:hypothetical protein FQN57_006523 [Myotisia sp. PD_48]
MSSDAKYQDAYHSSASIPGRDISPSNPSTVRPRNRRLISFATDDGDVDNDDGDIIATGRPSNSQQQTTSPPTSNFPPSAPYSSRTTSPTLNRHAMRKTAEPWNHGNGVFSSQTSFGDRQDLTNRRKPSAFASDFLESPWSSLQGLASNLMGTDNNTFLAGGKSSLQGHQRPRKSSRSGAGGRDRPPIPTTWGPPLIQIGESSPGAPEERQALLQARKREMLLQANGDSCVFDVKGNYKRRDSGEGPNPSTGALEENSEALVYIHHVQSNDNLTGLSIRYGCPLAIVRKSNGFWPSDSVQSRKVIVLPVDSCALKGCMIPDEMRQDPQSNAISNDLLDDTSSLVPNSTAIHGFGSGGASLESDHGFPSAQDDSGRESTTTQPFWKHQSWVRLEGFPSPVEIGRIPRSSLGYFPRARRKSHGEHLAPYTDSPTANSPPAYALSEGYSTPPPRLRDPLLGVNSRSTPGSRGSPFSNRNHSSQKSITLSGPGGVGTLGRNARGPGPPPDKLNNFVSTHLPNLVIQPLPPQELSFPSLNRSDRASFDSTDTAILSNSSTGIENVGGAIEGWFRKIAYKAKAGINDLQQQPPIGKQFANLGLGGNGDLIELGDTLENTKSNSSTRTIFEDMGEDRASGSQPQGQSSSSLRGRTWKSSSSREDM